MSEQPGIGMPPGGAPTMNPEELKKMMSAMPQKERKPTPQEEKYLGMVRELTELSTTLVIKIATCRCKDKENCRVYLHGVKVAEVMDKLQEAKPEIEKLAKTQKAENKKQKGAKNAKSRSRA
ncbi:hypothetical protein ES705_48810 [subsurface metagenome]